MRVLHDLRCVMCGKEERDVICDPLDLPACKCGGQRDWMPTKMTTDLYATPQYSDATGKVHSSQREKEKHMRDRGYYPCGDKVGGARVELSIKGTQFFGGGARRATARRSPSRATRSGSLA